MRERILRFLGKKIIFVDCADYAKARNVKYKILRNEKRNIEFYLLNNIISLDFTSSLCRQILMPRPRSLDEIIIFNDSFAYDHDDEELLTALFNVLVKDVDLIKIDEAAPLSHLWSYNFYHWTFECLPKLLALEELGYRGCYIVPNVKHVLECLEMFNINKKRVYFSDQQYLVSNMIIPENFNGYDLKNRPDIIDFLRGNLLNACGKLPGEKRTYVKRIGYRKVLNEEPFLKMLNNYGFDIMIPEDLAVKDQFRYMSNVEISVMPHGANCTLVTCQKKRSKYIEFFNNDYVNYHMLSVIGALNIDYSAKR